MTESDTSSELLPDDWNAGEFNYALRYIHDGQLYILHGIQSEGTLILNLLVSCAPHNLNFFFFNFLMSFLASKVIGSLKYCCSFRKYSQRN